MNDDIILNVVEMSQIISRLEQAIDKLENAYKDLNNKMKMIDDSSNFLSGDIQNEAYKCYLTIASDFSNSLKKMKALKEFLGNVVNSYISGDNSLINSINKNIQGLDLE